MRRCNFMLFLGTNSTQNSDKMSVVLLLADMGRCGHIPSFNMNEMTIGSINWIMGSNVIP